MPPTPSVAGVPVLTMRGRPPRFRWPCQSPVAVAVEVVVGAGWCLPGNPSTLAVLILMPGVLSVAVTVNVAGVPDATVAMVAVATPAAVVKVVPAGPPEMVALVAPAGNRSVTVTAGSCRRGVEVGHHQGISLGAAHGPA